jgi:non-specific serine/threonine protein kinase
MTLGDLGWVEMVRGDYGRAAEILEEAVARSRRVRVRQASAGLLTRLALAVLGRGDHERATALLEEGLVLGRELANKLGLVGSLEGMAMVAAAKGMDERAARLWGAAEVSREAIGAPLRADERAMYERYSADAQSGFGEEAWEAVRKEGRKMALEEAVEYALSDESILPVSPVPEQPPSGMQSATLRRREGEVAALVAQGFTNRQISAELVISEHTAATHVRRILKKLGLRSRAQIGSWLAEQRPSFTDPD